MADFHVSVIPSKDMLTIRPKYMTKNHNTVTHRLISPRQRWLCKLSQSIDQLMYPLSRKHSYWRKEQLNALKVGADAIYAFMFSVRYRDRSTGWNIKAGNIPCSQTLFSAISWDIIACSVSSRCYYVDDVTIVFISPTITITRLYQF